VATTKEKRSKTAASGTMRGSTDAAVALCPAPGIKTRGNAASDAKATGRVSTARFSSERLAAATITNVKAATTYTNVMSINATESAGFRSHTAPATATPKKVSETAAKMLSLVLAMAKMSKRAMAETNHSIATYQQRFKN
jgi:hypothetical protein